MREGERVAKASPSLASHHTHGRGRDAPVFVYDRWARQVCGQPVIQPKAGAVNSTRERIIKLLVDVRVDATHQSTSLDISIICVYRCINYNACMHAVTLLLILPPVLFTLHIRFV